MSAAPPQEAVSYYGQPVLKAPVWKWPVPAYFFTGGLAAGSSLLSLGAHVTGRRVLARNTALTSAAAIGVSGWFLIDDLGRPERFLNMLRVVKPTSPMNVGTWVFSAFGAGSAAAAASDLLGVAPGAGLAARTAAACLAPALATYTAVLIGDTAVPVWHEPVAELPLLFASGAAASAGGVACALAPPAEAGPARRLALAGAVGELVTSRLMERRLGGLADVYHRGEAGRLSRLSMACTVAGAVLLAVSGRPGPAPLRARGRSGPAPLRARGRSGPAPLRARGRPGHIRLRPGLGRTAAVAGGLLAAAGAAMERFAVFEAGVASAKDPAHTVGPQRARSVLRAPTVGIRG